MSVLLAIRGLPGTDKAAAAEKHRIRADRLVCNDDMFWVAGEYRYDAARVQEAVDACFDRVDALLDAPERRDVAVTNTFHRRGQLGAWAALAESHGYVFVAIDLFDGGLLDVQLRDRLTYDVPLDAIARFRAKWEP